MPAGASPAPFVFATRIGVGHNTVADRFNPITVAGIVSAVPISVAGGQVSINNGAFTSTPGLVGSGSTVIARVTSASTYDSLMTANVTIGGRASSFQVRDAQRSGGDIGFSRACAGREFSLLLLGSGVVLATGNNSAGPAGNGSIAQWAASARSPDSPASGAFRPVQSTHWCLDAFGNVWTMGLHNSGRAVGYRQHGEAPGEGAAAFHW